MQSLSTDAVAQIGCAILFVGAIWFGTAQAQSVAPAASPSQMPGSPQSVQVMPDPRYVGTATVQMAYPAPPIQFMLAWKYANERVVATVARSSGPTPVIPVYPRIPFTPSASGLTGPLQANPTFQADIVNEPMINTSYPPIPFADQ